MTQSRSSPSVPLELGRLSSVYLFAGSKRPVPAAAVRVYYVVAALAQVNAEFQMRKAE